MRNPEVFLQSVAPQFSLNPYIPARLVWLDTAEPLDSRYTLRPGLENFSLRAQSTLPSLFRTTELPLVPGSSELRFPIYTPVPLDTPVTLAIPSFFPVNPAWLRLRVK